VPASSSRTRGRECIVLGTSLCGWDSRGCEASSPLASASRTAIHLSNDVGLMVALVVWGPMAPTAVQVQEGAHTLNVNVHEGNDLFGYGISSRANLWSFLKRG